jgi:hypothetical protein
MTLRILYAPVRAGTRENAGGLLRICVVGQDIHRIRLQPLLGVHDVGGQGLRPQSGEGVASRPARGAPAILLLAGSIRALCLLE